MRIFSLKQAVLAFILLIPVAAFGQSERRKIEFESKNYAGYKELIAGTPASSVRVLGYLSIPAGAQGKVPAVVLLPHSGGYSENQERWYRAALNAAGFATLFVDNFTPRGLTPPVSVRDISYATVVADAYAALNELARLPEIDAARVAVVGFSRGAEAARQAAFESFRKGAGAGALRFAAHVPLYPLCVTSMRDPSDLTGAATLIMAGGKDDGTPAKNCEDYAAFMKTQKAEFPVEVRVYPEASHGWDDETNTGKYNPRAPSSAQCVPIFLSPQGEFTAMVKDRKEVPFEPSMLRCPGAGATLAFSAPLRERSTKDLIDFLKARFAGVK